MLMVRLGCCTEEHTFTECHESNLLFEMWKMLTKDTSDILSRTDDSYLSTDRLKLFAMIILKVAEARVLQDYLSTSVHGFDFTEALSHIKKYELFYINRLQNLTRQHQQKKIDLERLQTQGLTFKPQLTQTTIQLAHMKQSRQRPSNNGGAPKSIRGGVMQTFF